LAEIETRWANLRAGPNTLTEIEAHQMAAMVHGRWLQHHQDNPSDQTSWRTDLADRLFAPAKALSRMTFGNKLRTTSEFLVTSRTTALSYADYYNSVRTHRSLNKDAPVSRPVQRTGVTSSRAILGGLHHRYVRV
jgi:hypothetical protein